MEGEREKCRRPARPEQRMRRGEDGSSWRQSIVKYTILLAPEDAKRNREEGGGGPYGT